MSERNVVLMDGIKGGAHSVALLALLLRRRGYVPHICTYPATRAPIAVLARYIGRRLPAVERMHFVTHSMGGIVLRAWAAQGNADRIGRAVLRARQITGQRLLTGSGIGLYIKECTVLPGSNWEPAQTVTGGVWARCILRRA